MMKPEDDMSLKEWADLHGESDMPRYRGLKLREYLETQNFICELCGDVFHVDDMDEEYPDCCKECIKETE